MGNNAEKVEPERTKIHAAKETLRRSKLSRGRTLGEDVEGGAVGLADENGVANEGAEGEDEL